MGLIALTMSGTQLIAQTNEPTVEVIALMPDDQKPIGFSSQEELEKMVPIQIAECKTRIEKFQNEPEKVKYYREMIWRLENATITTISGASN